MANKKISQLTPKGSALAGTDLLEVSVFNGVTYDTKSLTGANVVSGLQPTLVSATNIKTINSTTLLGSGDIAVQPTLVSATNIKTINSTSLLGSGDIVISTGLTVGTTPITSGTVGRVLFEGTGNVVQQDSTLFWDNTNKRLGVGATPSTAVRLDVRAQGALSTDIAFRVRNSADSANIIEARGNASIVFANGISTYSLNPRTDADGFSLNSGNGLYGTGTGMEVVSNQFVINNSSTRTFRFTGSSVTNLWEFRNESGQLRICPTSDTTQPTLNINNTNVVLGGLSVGTSATKTFAIYSGTAPTTSPIDAFQQYSADITAGNAAPHFRTENGNVIKIYRETTAVAAAAFVSNTSLIANDSATFGGYTMGQVVAALKAQGLLA